jgi:hypothetical protein
MTLLGGLEAVNLDNLFGDCQDLSTTRGGGLAVLRIAESVASDLSAQKVSMGSSQGLLLIEGQSASEVEQRVRASLANSPLLEYATIMVKACEYDAAKFAQQKSDLKTAMRRSQMRSPSVVYPKLYDSQVCDVDKVRPGLERSDLEEKKCQSDFTYDRRKHGRGQKRALLKRILGTDYREFDVVSEFAEMADDQGRYGNLGKKLAVLRFDGNDFGEVGDACVTPELSLKFSQTTQAQQEEFFRKLIDGNPEWWTNDYLPKLRLEIVVYGGDEVTFITPAWLGWKALKAFYDHVQAWPPLELPNQSRQLTYSSGLVFCHEKAPIHAIKKLASGLCDQAKDRAKNEHQTKGNFAVYQALESFDAIGEDLDDFLKRRYQFSDGRGVCLGTEDIALLEDNMNYWRETLSRRRLHALAWAIEGGKPREDIEKEVRNLVESKSPQSVKAVAEVNALRSRLGDAALLHILELWDYAGVQL